MAKITYTFESEFNIEKAINGALCVVVTSNATSPISNVKLSGIDSNQWEENPEFIGAGICIKKSHSEVLITIDNSTYSFNYGGNPLGATPTDYRLRLAKIESDVMSVGLAATSTTTSVTKKYIPVTKVKGEVKPVISTETTDGGGEVIVDTLTARDQFAVQALKAIMPSIESPTTVDNSVINFYCDVAYRWAAGMMNAAANTRSTYEDTTKQTISTESLETNTEKILYDISQSLDKGASDTRKITELPDLVVDTLPSLSIGQMPNVTMVVSGPVQVSGTIQLGDTGIGRDAQHPLYISGDGMTLSEVDARIKAWLNATTIVADGTGWKLDVPNSI